MDRSMPLRIAQAAAMLCRVVRDMAAARLVLARFAVLGLASLAVAGCVSTPPVQTPAHYKAVVVDVSVLHAKGLGLYADRVQAAMAGSAARIFAGLVHPDDRNAPTLVLQITAIQFTEPMADWKGASGQTTDYMEGAGVIVSGNNVIERVPMMGGFTSHWSPQVLSPPDNPYRLQALCDFWAGWMRKKLGG